MTWLVATYEPTALFSLKDSQATSAAGKSLLVPSPYAIKTALIDVAVNWQGVKFAQEVFGWLRVLPVRSSPPRWACVTNAFIKVQRPPKNAEPGNPFKPTVAFREYVQFRGELRLALDISCLGETERQTLTSLLLRLNMLGKRGGFIQWQGSGELPELDISFVTHTGDVRTHLSGVIMHYLDDYGPKMTWDRLSTFTTDKPDRMIVSALIPYRLVRSSKRSTVYERTG
ncbi:hypothetical protein [Deinococcus gobiensis]|uniref:Uncharacterized protein n=1 Tax=Deinococcus gobiensis (strain DSM 21396 / JCM 16679 / CGMCC 1.7299 / I-0) TaxID=745776 RepID=H8H1R6_DEIGI|nr:hypothetical protein [Deinococcus gobiensis]AFD27463.1 hypothetical protein DGo_PB0194 [Deinococcus gobiensis I-0]